VKSNFQVLNLSLRTFLQYYHSTENVSVFAVVCGIVEIAVIVVLSAAIFI
jgi:hypothetical protein